MGQRPVHCLDCAGEQTSMYPSGAMRVLVGFLCVIATMAAPPILGSRSSVHRLDASLTMPPRGHVMALRGGEDTPSSATQAIAPEWTPVLLWAVLDIAVVCLLEFIPGIPWRLFPSHPKLGSFGNTALGVLAAALGSSLGAIGLLQFSRETGPTGATGLGSVGTGREPSRESGRVSHSLSGPESGHATSI